VISAHQPGSEPIDIPEVIPNPVVVPEQTPTPSEPAPRKPAETPEKVPVDYLPPQRGAPSHASQDRDHPAPGTPASRVELSGRSKRRRDLTRFLMIPARLMLCAWPHISTKVPTASTT
jgi:hypothetical protein